MRKVKCISKTFLDIKKAKLKWRSVGSRVNRFFGIESEENEQFIKKMFNK